MEKINIDFAKVEKLTNTIVQCSGVLEEQNILLQNDFKELNQEFDDAYYNEYAEKFYEGDRVVKEMRDCVEDIILAIVDYAEKMHDAKS